MHPNAWKYYAAILTSYVLFNPSPKKTVKNFKLAVSYLKPFKEGRGSLSLILKGNLNIRESFHKYVNFFVSHCYS